MDLGRFSQLLVPVQTDLVKIIRDYDFEGDKSSQRLGSNIEPRELNKYSMYSIIICIHSNTSRHSSPLPTHVEGLSPSPR